MKKQVVFLRISFVKIRYVKAVNMLNFVTEVVLGCPIIISVNLEWVISDVRKSIKRNEKNFLF